MGKETGVGEAERPVNGKKNEELRSREIEEPLIGIIVRAGRTRDSNQSRCLMDCFRVAAILGDDNMKDVAIVWVRMKVSEMRNSRN